MFKMNWFMIRTTCSQFKGRTQEEFAMCAILK
jgi:hypothetical protein